MWRSQLFGLQSGLQFSMLRMSYKPRQMPIRREEKPDLAQSTWKCVYLFPSGIYLCYVGGQFSWNSIKITKRIKQQEPTSWTKPAVTPQRVWGTGLHPACRSLSPPLEGTLVTVKAIVPGKIACFSVEVSRNLLRLRCYFVSQFPLSRSVMNQHSPAQPGVGKISVWKLLL